MQHSILARHCATFVIFLNAKLPLAPLHDMPSGALLRKRKARPELTKRRQAQQPVVAANEPATIAAGDGVSGDRVAGGGVLASAERTALAVGSVSDMLLAFVTSLVLEHLY